MSRVVELDVSFLYYSFRYALGRKTYVVNDVYQALKKHWDVIPPHQRENMKTEIRSALLNHDTGDNCDTRQWEEVLTWQVNE